MEIKFVNYQYKTKNISFEIPKSSIIGVTGSQIDEFIPILCLKSLNKGQITVNNEKVNKDNIYEYKRRISYVDRDLNTHKNIIIDLFNEHIKRNNLTIKDPTKKIKDSLRIVELSEDILTKDIYKLSSSEKKIIQFAIALLSNPNIIVLYEPFKCLDKHNEKKLIMLIQRLKEQFKKTIIIISDNSNILYKYTNEMIFIKNDDIFLTGPTNEVYLRVEYLKKNKFEIPDIIEFTHLAKKKKEVKIDYHKDVRDIIKDIYKHI